MWRWHCGILFGLAAGAALGAVGTGGAGRAQFRDPVAKEFAAARWPLSVTEQAQVEAVARAIALANLDDLAYELAAMIQYVRKSQTACCSSFLEAPAGVEPA